MKRTVNRVLARLAMFLIAIILGAIAVAQAQKGFDSKKDVAIQPSAQTPAPLAASLQPAPIPDTGGFSNAPMTPPPVQVQAEPVAMEATQMPNEPAPSTQFNDQYAEQPYDAQYDTSTEYQEAYVPATPSMQNAEIQTTGGYADESSDGFSAMPIQPPVQEATQEPAMPPPAAFAPPQMAAPEASTDFAAPAANAYATPTNPEPSYQGQFSEPEFSNTGDYNGSTTIRVADNTPPPMQPMQPSTPPANLSNLPVSQNMAPSTDTYAPPQQFNSPPPTVNYNNTALRNDAYGNDLAGTPNSVPPTSTFSATSGGNGELGGNGKPGPAELEGPQSPNLTVFKKSPQEVQVGKPAKFEITVRNAGQVEAKDVVIRDQVPHGTRLIDTNPPSTRQPDGSIIWQMGSLRPGGETKVVMEIMPMEEGEIGSVATVTFRAAASASTLVTRPQLTLEHTTQRQILVGDDVIFNIKLANPGTGVATNVVIEENVPPGLKHYDGNELEYPIGTLRPGETRVLELTLKADEAGMVDNILIAKADGQLQVEDHCPLEIVAPEIKVEIDGPKRRFLERRANYEIHVANPGTAPAQNIELVAQLPRALKFVNTNNAGQYDSQRHAVIWNLAELPAQEMGTVNLETMPIQMGEHRIQVDVRGSMGLVDAVEHQVMVDGLAALLYTVTDVSDPIEVGGQTTYEIHIVNQGSKAATNLRLGAMIPPGMEPINGEGPTRVAMEGSRVLFEPLARLAPQADTFYKIHVRGVQPGDKRITVRLMSDEVTEPVTKEESTHVYADE